MNDRSSALRRAIWQHEFPDRASYCLSGSKNTAPKPVIDQRQHRGRSCRWRPTAIERSFGVLNFASRPKASLDKPALSVKVLVIVLHQVMWQYLVQQKLQQQFCALA